MVGVGPGALRKREMNLITKRILLAVQSVIELVVILEIRNETP